MTGRLAEKVAIVTGAFPASDDSAFYTGADFDLDGGVTRSHGELLELDPLPLTLLFEQLGEWS